MKGNTIIMIGKQIDVLVKLTASAEEPSHVNGRAANQELPKET